MEDRSVTSLPARPPQPESHQTSAPVVVMHAPLRDVKGAVPLSEDDIARQIQAMTADPDSVTIRIGVDGVVRPMNAGQEDPELAQQFSLMMNSLAIQTSFGEQLQAAPRPLTPKVMESLAAQVRLAVMQTPDPAMALNFGELALAAGGHELTPALVGPVLKEIMRGTPSLGEARIRMAMDSLCALHQGKRLPDGWFAAMFLSAQSLLDPKDPASTSSALEWMMDTALRLQPVGHARAALESALLRLALTFCPKAPAMPIGLIGWMKQATGHASSEAVLASFLAAMGEKPAPPVHAIGNAITLLGAVVVSKSPASAAQVAALMKPLLVWAMAPEREKAQRDAALYGLVRGMGELAEHPLGPGHMACVLETVAQLNVLPQDDDACQALKAFVSQLLEFTLQAEPDAMQQRDTKDASAEAPARSAQNDAHLMAALRMLLAPDRRDADGVEPTILNAEPALHPTALSVLGQMIVNAAPGITPATVATITRELMRSDLSTVTVGCLFHGMALALGEWALDDAFLPAFTASMSDADLMRGALLTVFVASGMDAEGEAGRKRETSLRARMETANLGLALAPPVALGVRIHDDPLGALRGAGLSTPEQLKGLLGMCRTPGGLDTVILSEQAFDCALLAGRDLDFALKAALTLACNGGPGMTETSFRDLRAALVSQIIAASEREPAARPGGADSKREVGAPGAPAPADLRASRVRSLAVIYSAFVNHPTRNLVDTPEAQAPAIAAETPAISGKSKKGMPATSKPKPPVITPQAAAQARFLRSEIALLETGEGAVLLAPVRTSLDEMARKFETAGHAPIRRPAGE